jgi:hypothetical protein
MKSGIRIESSLLQFVNQTSSLRDLPIESLPVDNCDKSTHDDDAMEAQQHSQKGHLKNRVLDNAG